jgi:hypothetical protein
MYKITLDIGGFSEVIIGSQPLLVLEVGTTALNYMIMQSDRSLQKLRYYQIDNNNPADLPETLEEILATDDLLGKNFSNCHIIYNFSSNQLIPEKYYHEHINKQLLEVIHGDLVKGVILHEKVEDLHAHNVYRIPKDIHQILSRKFPLNTQHHYYTLLLEHLYKNAGVDSDKVVVSFYRKNIIAIVVKDSKLQLMQQFGYQTTEDVAYWLLNIYNQFNLEQLSTPLEISGMIDEDSAMYTELLKYFSRIDFESHPDYIKEGVLLQGYPKHFFSPILKLATCVS